jgi:transposase InsO family protein
MLDCAVAASASREASGRITAASSPRASAYANGVILDFSRPGKPMDNAFIESFNACVRLECLNQH